MQRVNWMPLGALAFMAINGIDVACAGGIGYAEGTEVIEGKFDVVYSDQSSGRMVLNGTNRSKSVKETKGDGLFDNVEKACSGITWDLIRGNGAGSGYCKAGKAGDQYVVHWTGYVSAITGLDGKPTPKYSGSWFLVAGAGTGRYAGLEGNGLWWGTLDGQGNFVEQWNIYYQK